MLSREVVLKLRKMIIRTSESLTDAEAYDVFELFEMWLPDHDYSMGKRLQYDGKLWKVRQAHTSQAQYPPSIYTAALYEEVTEPGQGDTPDNPIPYNNNMELFEGKYYSQFGVVYICIRSTGTAVFNNLADLVGIYVEVYE